jgi:hypothetical protein
MPLDLWQEQLLGQTYEPEDIEAALRDDPRAKQTPVGSTGSVHRARTARETARGPRAL